MRSRSVVLVLFALGAAGAVPLHLHGQHAVEAVPRVIPIGDTIAAGGVAVPGRGVAVPGPAAPVAAVSLRAARLTALRFPAATADAAPLRPLSPAADLDRRLAERELLSRRWVYAGIGAAVGGAIGFALAAPSCLDGSNDCGNRTLTYALIGTLTGGVAGLAVGMAADR